MGRVKSATRNIAFGYVGQVATALISFVLRTVFILHLSKELLGINSTYANVFEAANCPIVLLHDMPFKSNEFNKLPATTKWGIPENNLDFIWNQSKELDIDRMTFPVFLLCDHDGNVFFVKQGYTIHLGEQLLKVIKKLQEKQ